MTRTLALVAAFAWAAIASAITIDTVPIGNPGNAPDTEVMITDSTTGYGSVSYNYQIGKYDVTAGQYTDFLNAVADEDPNGLYNTDMDSPAGAHIQRTGSSPNFSYNVAADWANRPVNFVSFWDAARFANWLHNGQPTGAQGPGTTEGGAYHNVGSQTLFGRNAGARFFIPNENEWYKAAYHNKAAGLASSYFDFPTGTNATPGNNINETTNPGNNANYTTNAFAIGSPYYRTVVGEFELSDSPYGTFDQGGNVWEWDETALIGSSRGLRGGTFDYNQYTMQSYSRYWTMPANEAGDIGFRVASIPEPSTILLGAVGCVFAFGLRRKSILQDHV
jgi:formylglycine-generating enzyme required for sulfatase activity